MGVSETTPTAPQHPIFIGGCDRSGTTMLGALLGRHASCVVTPESPFKTDVLSRLRPGSADEGRRALELIGASWRFRIWGHQVPTGVEPAAFPEAIGALVSSFASRHGRPATARWVDHTPNNVRYAKTLLEAFPSARFIHVVRDGRAVANSVMPLDWGPNTVLYAAPWWVERLSYGLAAESSLGPRTVLRVRYEDLLLAPDDQLKRIHAFLELPEEEAAAPGDGYRSPSYTAGQHVLVGSAPDASRLDRYRESLSAREIELFEWATKDLLGYLGYEQDYGVRAKGPSFAERASAALREAALDRLNRWRNSRRRAAALEGAGAA